MLELKTAEAKTGAGAEGKSCITEAAITCATGLCCGFGPATDKEKADGQKIVGPDNIGKMQAFSATCQKKDLKTLIEKNKDGTVKRTGAWACKTAEEFKVAKMTVKEKAADTAAKKKVEDDKAKAATNATWLVTSSLATLATLYMV